LPEIPSERRVEGPAGQDGFTGHIKDAATGLNYMQARYYDPAIGRFLSIDPVGFSVDQPFMFGRYSYVGNDPVNAWDPFGEGPWGFVVKRVKGGLKIIKRLETKQDATAAARKGADIEAAGGLKQARSVAKDTLSEPGALRKDPGHVLKDGSGKIGKLNRSGFTGGS
jgi:RHS repeat-associated protein